MTTSLKVILAAAAISVLASPVMAESGRQTVSSDEWNAAGETQHAARPPANIARAHGSVSHSRASRFVPAAGTEEAKQIRIDDCVHVTFPQCGGL
jgi:hypothetical protein